MNHEEKYKFLIRALIMPQAWRILPYGGEVPYEDREKCLDAGIKRFDEIFAATKVLKAALETAKEAIRETAKELADGRGLKP